MLKITATKDELKECLNSLIWTFKIGDNILYNLDVLFQLVDDHNTLKGRNYAKPTSILCISIIEAILIDFLERLDAATNHFPEKLSAKREAIKTHLEGQKNKVQTTYEGKILIYRRLKNFGYKELIEFYDKYKILGSNPKTYTTLQNLGHFRNRVHIRNYFGNFENDESRTFSETRTQKAIDYMEAVFKYLKKTYPRP